VYLHTEWVVVSRRRGISRIPHLKIGTTDVVNSRNPATFASILPVARPLCPLSLLEFLFSPPLLLVGTFHKYLDDTGMHGLALLLVSERLIHTFGFGTCAQLTETVAFPIRRGFSEASSTYTACHPVLVSLQMIKLPQSSCLCEVRASKGKTTPKKIEKNRANPHLLQKPTFLPEPRQCVYQGSSTPLLFTEQSQNITNCRTTNTIGVGEIVGACAVLAVCTRVLCVCMCE
jgi:hypothetical protein